MLEFFFIERGGYYELLPGAYGLLITNKIKNKNKQTYSSLISSSITSFS